MRVSYEAASRGTREITFFDPSAASSAQSWIHCRVVRRLVEMACATFLETSQAIGRNRKPKDASEMCTSLEHNRLRMSSGQISEDARRNNHMVAAETYLQLTATYDRSGEIARLADRGLIGLGSLDNGLVESVLIHVS